MIKHLKNCIKCGRKSEFEYFEDSFGETKGHVFCTNWRCVFVTKPYNTEKEAIEAWNTRVK